MMSSPVKVGCLTDCEWRWTDAVGVKWTSIEAMRRKEKHERLGSKDIARGEDVGLKDSEVRRSEHGWGGLEAGTSAWEWE